MPSERPAGSKLNFHNTVASVKPSVVAYNRSRDERLVQSSSDGSVELALRFCFERTAARPRDDNLVQQPSENATGCGGPHQERLIASSTNREGVTVCWKPECMDSASSMGNSLMVATVGLGPHRAAPSPGS